MSLQPQPQPETVPPSAGDFPVRQPHARLVQPGGRHRRPVPASLPEGAPALVLAVPSVSEDGLTGPTAEIATVLRVDNPALDVRTARIDHGGRGDPAGIRAVLADAAARRPAGAPSAVIVPQLVTPYPETFRALREAIAATGANAHIGEVFNTNALLAEALHHRLADAGLARADRVRMFSITTSADGIILVTVGGEEAVGTASVTAVLLAARLALPVLAASLDAGPGIEEAAAQPDRPRPVRDRARSRSRGHRGCGRGRRRQVRRATRRARQRGQAHLAGVRPGTGPAGDPAHRLRSARRADGADGDAGLVDAVDADERAGVRGVDHHAVADVDPDVVDGAGV
jgi:hypothetical protein